MMKADSLSQRPHHFLSIVAITKSEHEYLFEWIEYHLKVGVDHFYIYDNNDDNDFTYKILQDYIAKGIVDYIKWPDVYPFPFWLNCQPKAYMDCIQKVRNNNDTEWLAIIDTDEFILPMEGNSLREVLKKHFSQHKLIYVNWKFFGTSYKWLTNKNDMLSNLTLCAPSDHIRHLLGKTIMRPATATVMQNPHLVNSTDTYVNGSGEIALDQPFGDKYLRINHYTFRDESYFSNYKIPRMHVNETIDEDPKIAEEGFRLLNYYYCKNECLKMKELLGSF